MTEADLRRRMRPDMNIGIRLGEPSEVGRRRWVYGVDIDIRAPNATDEAWDALLSVFPNAEDWPRVISGSGGASRHLYLLSDAVFRKTNIARSQRKITVRTADGLREKPEWEIDFYGTGSQMVLPPSIHPDTSKPYCWAEGDTPRRWLDLPFVRQTHIAPFFERPAGKRERKRKDYPVEPIDSLEEILDTRALDNDGDGLHYDDWRDVIFAVKQEYDGTDELDEAFQALEEWSQRSDKHDQKRFEEVWDHARTDRADGITFGSLKKRTAPELDERRKARIVDSMEDERSNDDKSGNPKPDEWMRLIKRDGLGAPTNVAENRLLILQNEPALDCLVWAEEEQCPVWRKPEGEVPPDLRNLTFNHARHIPYDPRSHYQVLQICFSRKPYYMDTVRKEELNDSVYLSSQKRTWHRIQEMLTLEKWDGKRRVETLLQDYLGVADSAYARDVSKLLVLGPMCRVLWRGVKVDYAPILQGPQGTGKDRFLELLCTFGDEILYTASTFDIKKPSEYVQAIRGKLIVHLAEMATFRRSTNEEMKTFLTDHEDTARLAYEPLARTYRRLCIFVFSVNEKGGYLTDNTGNRRYLPVELGDPKPGPDGKPTAFKRNFQELEKVRAQIWAEAYEMALEEAKRQGGERVRELLISPEALKIARELQTEKMAETPEHDIVARAVRILERPVPLDDLLDEKDRTEETARKMAVRNQVATREFWIYVLGEKRETWTRNTHLTTRAMDMLPGWHRVKSKQRHKGEIRNVYRRNDTNGEPEIVDDMVAPASAKIIKMDDERAKRRSSRDN